MFCVKGGVGLVVLFQGCQGCIVNNLMVNCIVNRYFEKVKNEVDQVNRYFELEFLTSGGL